MRLMTRADIMSLPERQYPIICMLREEFERLPEYSATWPTGATPGKRWRRHDGAHDPRVGIRKAKWFVLEYGPLESYLDRGETKQGCRTIWYVPVLSRDMVDGDL